MIELSRLALTVVAGLFWGSFLAQVVARTPHRHPPSGGSPPLAGLSLFHPPRSHCFSCGVLIPWYDNVPVLSYLLLKGRCRRCGAAIGWPTLAVELATPAALAGVAFLFGWRALVVWGVFLVTTAVLAAGWGLEHRRPGAHWLIPAVLGLASIAAAWIWPGAPAG